MNYRNVLTYHKIIKPPMVYKVSGQVTLSGSPQQNAIVSLIDSVNKQFVGQKITDASGNYSFDSTYPINGSQYYHVIVEYDSGTQKYNASSLPYITPAEN